jgi:hypothetical protein
MAMANWCAYVLDVQGAFLNGQFEDGEELFMQVPEGFKRHYPGDIVLKLQCTIYGLKQAAYAFWRELLKASRQLSTPGAKLPHVYITNGSMTMMD